MKMKSEFVYVKKSGIEKALFYYQHVQSVQKIYKLLKTPKHLLSEFLALKVGMCNSGIFIQFNSNSIRGHELQFNSKSVQCTASGNFQNSHQENHYFMDIFAFTIPAVVFCGTF